MKFGIICGSHRNSSQSSKVGKFVEERLVDLFPETSTYILDLANNPLPLWDSSKWESGGELKERWAPYSKELSSCDAFIVISPEWAGMVPPGLKNFFLLCDGRELAHKPGLIVAISASRGGAYPVAELRMSSYKNTHIIYIPDHIIVRSVESVLNSVATEEKEDVYVRERLDYSLRILNEYGRALSSVRAADLFDFKKYPFGM
jgi:NAD(P)H-dependent FMN reductase